MFSVILDSVLRKVQGKYYLRRDSPWIWIRLSLEFDQVKTNRDDTLDDIGIISPVSTLLPESKYAFDIGHHHYPRFLTARCP